MAFLQASASMWPIMRPTRGKPNWNSPESNICRDRHRGAEPGATGAGGEAEVEINDTDSD